MYCSKCGKEIKDDASFCPYCGEPVDNNVAGSNNQQQASSNTQTEPPDYTYQGPSNGQAPKNNHRGPIIAGCIAAVVVVFIVVGLIVSSGNGIDSQSADENVNTLVTNESSNVLMHQDTREYEEDGETKIELVSVLGSIFRPNVIESVTFLDSFEGMPDDSWDVSANQDGTVMAWVMSTESGLCNLYIAANGGVYANPESDHLFWGYTNLKSIDFNGCFHTDNVITMESMFGHCNSLESLNVSYWNTSNVTNMSGMFYDCSSLNTIIYDGWDTSNVTDMSYIFLACSSLTSLDISDWDTSHVTDMTNMFCRCESLKGMNLNNLDTSQVTNMSGLFYDCKSLETLEIERWDTGNVTNMRYMFSGCSSLTSTYLNYWNTSKVTNMEGMFSSCSSLNDTIGRAWDTSHVTNMKQMYYRCTSLTGANVNSWDISSVTDMSYMFADCSNMKYLVMPASFDDSNADKTGITDGTQVEQAEIQTGNVVG